MSIAMEPMALCEVEGGSRLEMDHQDMAAIHFVLAGYGSMRAGGQELELHPGCLVVVPKGTQHEITAARRTSHAPVMAASGLAHHRSLGPRGKADLITACARLTVRFGDAYGLFEVLDEPIVIDFSSSPEMRALFDDMLVESGSRQPGALAMLTAHMNRCMVLMFRRLCESDDCSLPWLNALEDERMAKALDIMLTDPGRPHSIESLARDVAMSRTAFAREFRSSFGTPPMTFLRGIRLRRAAELLITTTLGIGAIAARVGFSSRAHFSTAFRSQFGVPPGAFRTSPVAA
jgi:AraC-like DNA-binding protein/quercetin dioxygenase-like cupin family protein